MAARADLTLLANFHGRATRYLLSRSNCFPAARGAPATTTMPTATSTTTTTTATGYTAQDYLRYGRGHLCRNETSASSAQPNFGNSLSPLVDANSYPLVFPAGNLARPVSPGKFLRPLASLSLVCLTDDSSGIDSHRSSLFQVTQIGNRI